MNVCGCIGTRLNCIQFNCTIVRSYHIMVRYYRKYQLRKWHSLLNISVRQRLGTLCHSPTYQLHTPITSVYFQHFKTTCSYMPENIRRIQSLDNGDNMLDHIVTLIYALSYQCIVTRTIYSAIHALQWRHNEHDGVSNHQPHDCLLNRLYRRRSKKTSKLRVTGLCAGNSLHKGPVTRKMFPFDDVIMEFLVLVVIGDGLDA